MITTITFLYTLPLASTTNFVAQATEASLVPLPLAPYDTMFPLTLSSDTTTQDSVNIYRTLVYTPNQPAFDSLFTASPTSDQAKAFLRNLWTMVLAKALCTLVTEVITVA